MENLKDYELKKLIFVEYYDVITEALQLFNSAGLPKGAYTDTSKAFPILNFGKVYGKSAFDLYLSCCERLSFDPCLSEHFDLRQLLYATNATPEGYSAWMLPNSSLTGNYSGQWANVIKNDIIYEVHKQPDEGDTNHRVTFVKQGDGNYVFWGVYAFEKIVPLGGIVIEGIPLYFIKIYKRISKTYPIP